MTQRAKKSLADRLREARIALGFSQRGLAREAGISSELIRQIEDGDHVNPSIGTIRKLASALGLLTSDLIED